VADDENPYDPPLVDAQTVEAEAVCLRCGTAMEKGMVQSLGNITWYPEMASFKPSVPQRLSPKGINLETKLSAYRCPACETVTINKSDA
jgi:DNA-directed RNA polymerase subunit RPC12/RpoP